MRQVAGVQQRPPENELDLRVEAPQLVVGPSLQSLMDGRIDPERKRFPFSH